MLVKKLIIIISIIGLIFLMSCNENSSVNEPTLDENEYAASNNKIFPGDELQEPEPEARINVSVRRILEGGIFEDDIEIWSNTELDNFVENLNSAQSIQGKFELLQSINIVPPGMSLTEFRQIMQHQNLEISPSEGRIPGGERRRQGGEEHRDSISHIRDIIPAERDTAITEPVDSLHLMHFCSGEDCYIEDAGINGIFILARNGNTRICMFSMSGGYADFDCENDFSCSFEADNFIAFHIRGWGGNFHPPLPFYCIRPIIFDRTFDGPAAGRVTAYWQE